MGDCGWLWMVADGCGWLRVVFWVIFGRLWMAVDGCGWFWVVADSFG